MNQTDPVLEFITVLVLNSNNNFSVFVTQTVRWAMIVWLQKALNIWLLLRRSVLWLISLLSNNVFSFHTLLGRREWATVTAWCTVTWRGRWPRKKCVSSTETLSRQRRKSSERREDTELSQQSSWRSSTFCNGIHRCSHISLWWLIKMWKLSETTALS